MKRSDLLEKMLNWKCECDILVIGGGARTRGCCGCSLQGVQGYSIGTA